MRLYRISKPIQVGLVVLFGLGVYWCTDYYIIQRPAVYQTVKSPDERYTANSIYIYKRGDFITINTNHGSEVAKISTIGTVIKKLSWKDADTLVIDYIGSIPPYESSDSLHKVNVIYRHVTE